MSARGWRCSACSDVTVCHITVAPALSALRRQKVAHFVGDTVVGHLDTGNERPLASAAHTVLSGLASEPTRDSVRFTSFYNSSADASRY